LPKYTFIPNESLLVSMIRDLTARTLAPYVCLPLTPATKAEAEAALRGMMSNLGVELEDDFFLKVKLVI